VFTYLVFHHALRIRFKSDILSDGEEKNKKLGASAPESTLETPATADADSTTAVEHQEGGSESQTEADAASVPEPKEGQAQQRTANLAGKINNLLTADITTISGCEEVVLLRMSVRPLCIIHKTLNSHRGVQLLRLSSWVSRPGISTTC
jgi:hypothetical protein